MKKSLYLQKIKGLLFDNASTRQIIAKNAFWLTAAEFFSRFFKFFLIVFAARILGVTEYGKFSFALAFATFFIVFADFGLDNILVREFARDKNQERKFPAILALRILLSALMVLVIWSGSFFASGDPTVRFAIWILAFYIFFQSIKSVFIAFFQARQRMEYAAIAQILETIFLTGIGLFVLFNFPSIQALGLTYALMAFAGLVFIFIIFKKKIYPPALSFAPKTWKQFLSLSWPLGLVGLSGTIFNQIDSITLGLYGQITQVGWYNAAYAIFGAVLLPSWILWHTFFPALSRAFGESKGSFQKIYNFQMEAAIFLSLGFLAGGIALAPKIIDFFYDPSYAPSALALRILLAAAAAIILSEPIRQALIAMNQQKKLFWAVLAGSLLNAALDVWLIPTWSLYGPAFATFIGTVLMTFLFSFYASRALRLGSFSLLLIFVGAIIASAVTYKFLLLPQIFRLHVLAATLLGGLVYCAIFLVWRALVYKIFIARLAENANLR